MSNILFVTLFDLNSTYIQMGEGLDIRHNCYYVCSTRNAYEELISSGIPPQRILNLSKKRVKVSLKEIETNRSILSNYEDARLSISSIFTASRMLSGENSDFIQSYMAESIQKIDRFFTDNKIELVITEPTDCIQLLSQLVCWKRGIKFGQIVPVRYPVNRIALSVDCFEDEFYKLKNNVKKNDLGMEKWLQEYRSSNIKPQYYSNAVQYKPFIKLTKSLLSRVPIEIKKLFGDYEINNLNTYYLIKIYSRNIIRRIFFRGDNKRDLRNKIKNQKYFVYYLHVQPERSIDVVSPSHTNQLEIIKQLRRSLPWDIELWVKDHPASDGAQSLNFYRSLKNIVGARLMSRNYDSKILGLNSIGVATVSGTIGYEMALNNIPVVVFSNIFYKRLPTVYQFDNPEGLSKYMREIVNNKIDKNNDQEIINFLEDMVINSVESEWNFIAGKLKINIVESLVNLIEKIQK